MASIALPAVSLAAVPGRRRATLDLAREIERRGFAGIYCPSFGDGVGLCEALAFATERIPFGTSIANIYVRHVADYAQTASLIHELSGGRFRFGVGVSHGPALERLGVKAGRSARRHARVRRAACTRTPRAGEQPPIVLATLRKQMIALAARGRAGHGLRERRALAHARVALGAARTRARTIPPSSSGT